MLNLDHSQVGYRVVFSSLASIFLFICYFLMSFLPSNWMMWVLHVFRQPRSMEVSGQFLNCSVRFFGAGSELPNFREMLQIITDALKHPGGNQPS